MSKLESAFSKALKEKGLTSDGRPGDSAPESFDARKVLNSDEKMLAPRNPAKLKDIVSSRSQISNMVHKKLLSEQELADKRLVYPKMRDKKLLTLYRNLRIKLLAISENKNFTTLITSVVPGGGSSLVAANLAATFAFDEGKTSLLIEGNIHSPSLANLFDLEADSKGLMECMESDSLTVGDILYETGVPRLRLIPGGKVRENSAEYFASGKMKSTFQEIVDKYPERYPIIDAPSVNESADARILVDLSDFVVLVVPYGMCSEEDIKNAAKAIGKNKLVGTVLNQF